MKIYSLAERALKPVAGCIVAVLIAACSSGDGSTTEVDESTLLNEPVIVSEPVIAGTSGNQSFELEEDGLLLGLFYHPEGEEPNPVTIRSLPSSGVLTLQPGGKVFVYTPTRDFWGNDTFDYETYSGIRLTVNLSVESVDDPPVLSADIPRVAAQGQRFVYQLEVSDADGDELRFSASGLPAWLTLDASSGVLSGIPSQSDIGFSDEVVLSVTDSKGLSDEALGIRFEVIDVNDAPTLNLSRLPSELLARQSVTEEVFPQDADGDVVLLEVEDNDFVAGGAVDGSVTLTARDVNEVMDVNVVIKATDQRGRVSREIQPIRIYPLTESGKGITLSGIASGRAVHVVVLGDGYTSDQQPLFREHVERTIENLRADEGIVRHFDALSIHMVSTVSEDSGSDDSDTSNARDTYYDSAYNCGSIERLICANSLTMLETAIEEYPDFDQVILLVNDRRYGGSGNSGARYAMTSAYFPEIALHEMGHSLANLADEYVDNVLVESTGFPAFVEGDYANITALTDPEQVPWAHWIDPDESLPRFDGEQGIGLFEGGLYRSVGVFRPTFDSRMRSFGAQFGPVNSERWILRLYEETSGGIRGFSPALETLQLLRGETQEFVVSPIFATDIQSIEWELDGEPLDAGPDPGRLKLVATRGEHVLSVTVQDISGAIRQPLPHAGIFKWTWTLEVQ